MTDLAVVDCSGWIEYFLDSPRADLFAPAIERRHHLLVATIALFEVHRVLSRKVPPEAVHACLNVMRLGRVLDITAPRAVAGAEVALRHKLAMGDALMYSLALEHGATLWTQDEDDENLPDVRYFAKTARHAPKA